MNKKDIVFLATTLMLAPHKLNSPTDKTDTAPFKTWYLNWYNLLSEIYDQCPTDSQKK